jgi:hypothetical protein
LLGKPEGKRPLGRPRCRWVKIFIKYRISLNAETKILDFTVCSLLHYFVYFICLHVYLLHMQGVLEGSWTVTVVTAVVKEDERGG